MVTAAKRAILATLRLGDGGAPEMFNNVAEVLTINGPSLNADLIDVTNQDSAGGYREFISGALDGGEVTFGINYLPDNSTHNETTGLLGEFGAVAASNYELGFPDGAGGQDKVYTFAGRVTGWAPVLDINAQIQANVTVKVTGAVTFAESHT